MFVCSVGGICLRIFRVVSPWVVPVYCGGVLLSFTVEGSPLEGGWVYYADSGVSLEGMVRHVMDGPDSMFRWMVPGVGSAWICFCTVALAFSTNSLVWCLAVSV